MHLRDLGTPKEGRLAARAGHHAELKRIYDAHVATPKAQEAMDELAALVRKAGPVCLLCYEREHTHCHRRFIADIIEDREQVDVENLVASPV